MLSVKSYTKNVISTKFLSIDDPFLLKKMHLQGVISNI